MRYDCPVPGFEATDFVDVKERWTRKDVRLFYELRGEEYLTFLQSKLGALHLSNESGSVMTAPGDLTLEKVEEVDLMVWKWFSTAINKALDQLYSLGEEIASHWSKEQELMTTQDGSPKQS